MGMGGGGGIGGFDPISMIGSFVLGQVAGQLFGKKGSDIQASVAPPAPAAAVAAPQASQAPDVATTRANTVAATSGGESSTLLTGLGGVDPKSLNLGKNTLLGE